MTMRPHSPGWVKLPRNLLYTPVWESHSAWRVFCRLVLTAGYADRQETVSGRPFFLSRGQVASSQAEIGASAGLSRKAVRCAMELLERERAVVCIPCHGGKTTVFQICGYPLCQGEERDKLPENGGGPHQGPGSGPIQCHARGQDSGIVNANENSMLPVHEKPPGAMSDAGLGPDMGPSFGPVFYKEEEVKKKRNNPPTPFEKGGASSFRSLVLDMWRKEREAAGLAFCEDRPTRKGASLLAENWLDTGKAKPEHIRQAMANIIREIRTNPKARLFDLRTLANSLSKYLEPPKADAQPKKRMWWRWICDTCGKDHVGMVPTGVTPSPAPCLNTKFGRCDGAAHPKCEGEVTL